MDDKACDLLSEVDENFNNGGVNVVKFNKFTKCHSYCPYENTSKKNKCTNDYERVNALGSYLFTKIMEIDNAFKGSIGDKRHIEVFMIWLGDKLFRIENDYKATLEESYKKNLERIMGNVKYWEAIDSKKLYKRATIKKMNEYYGLLNYICKLIIEYNTNIQNPQKHNRNRLGNYSTKCINFYRSILSSANGCKPYLQLLDNLKMIYENFRMHKIDYNNNIPSKDRILLLKRIKHLTTFKDENRLFVFLSENPSFDDKECKEAKSKDEQIGEQILQSKPKGNGLTKKPDTATQGRASGKFQSANPSDSKPAPAPPKKAEQPPAKPAGVKLPQQPQLSPPSLPQTLQKSGANHQSGTKDSGGNKGNKGGGVSQPGSSEGKPKDDGQKKTDQVGTTSPGLKAGSQPKGAKNQGSGARGQGGSGNKVNTDKQTKHSGDSSHENTAPAPSGAGTPQSPVMTTSGAPQSTDTIPPSVQPPEKPQPQPQPKPEVKDQTSQPQTSQQNQTQPVAPPATPPDPLSPAPPSQDGSSLQTPQAGGSNSQNEPKDLGSSKGSTGDANGNKGDPSGGSSDPASSKSVGSFDWRSSIFEFILKGKEYYNKASELIKDNQQKFKDAAEKISDAYNTTVDSLKSAYNVSNNYVNDFVKDVIDQLNKTNTPSKQNGNQPGSGSQIGGGNPTNHLPQSQPQNTTDPSKVPSQNPAPTPIKDPPSNLSLPPQLPSPPKSPLQQGQPLLQSQSITPQNPQVKQTNHQKIGQFVKSLSSDLILKKPWNIFPTTWNGSGDCKPEIKFMNATLVCCTSEQCSLTGITVILVLIPIILLIAYKYLSFGSSKKSEKKNMKRVINFHDGKSKTKIIISSNDRSKHLKPVINLVGGKKKSLLNIYKLIRADPMPFINLFFLLIFFVYKRKRDTIE
ncbi:PIR protein CIR protein [Plasmodium vinckei]|uniref:PIR protein CIR protein n=1 Tax=Plasmodium vinckei TaxID=5860 RepID=A0A6V7T9I8_PLAVN|nr:PIR protein CIR protein [Plasmodium vinckei]